MESLSYWDNIAKKEIERSKKRIEIAKALIPKEYHWFLVFLKKNQKLGRSKTKEKGIYTWQNDSNDVYVSIYEPYMSVDGRIKMARDEHKKAGKKLFFHPPVITDSYVSVTVESEIYGSATGTAKIGKGGSGVDSTNPIENAETSAIGRALGFLGYGLFGTGVASAEEVIAAIEERESKEKLDQQQSQEHKNTKEKDKGTEQQGKGKIVEIETLKGKIVNFKTQGKNLGIFLDTGEVVVFPVDYPAFQSKPPQKGAMIEVKVKRSDKNNVVAGTTGKEFNYIPESDAVDELPEEAIY